MRAVTLVAMGLVMGASLAGCDQTPAPQQQTAQVAPPAPVAPPPCNCGEHAVPDNQLTRLSDVSRHHHQYARDHGSYTSHSEESVITYDYVSASRVSYSEESESYESGGGYDASGYAAYGHRYYPPGVVWVDGYGRSYFAGARPTVAQEMSGKRAAVWHGYDTDCPEHPLQSDGY